MKTYNVGDIVILKDNDFGYINEVLESSCEYIMGVVVDDKEDQIKSVPFSAVKGIAKNAPFTYRMAAKRQMHYRGTYFIWYVHYKLNEYLRNRNYAHKPNSRFLWSIDRWLHVKFGYPDIGYVFKGVPNPQGRIPTEEDRIVIRNKWNEEHPGQPMTYSDGTLW